VVVVLLDNASCLGSSFIAGLHLRASIHPSSPDYIFVLRFILHRRITPRASAHPAYGWVVVGLRVGVSYGFVGRMREVRPLSGVGVLVCSLIVIETFGPTAITGGVGDVNWIFAFPV